MLATRRRSLTTNEGTVLPRAMPLMYPAERMYPALLGPLAGEPMIGAECLFADPVADIAVLGGIDSRELPEQGEAYDALVGGPEPVFIGEPQWGEKDVRMLPAIPALGVPERRFVGSYEAPGWLLSLDGRWLACRVIHNDGRLWIADTAEKIQGGMSGSPILSGAGKAVGIVCVDAGSNPRLTHNRPGWGFSG